MLTKSRLAGCMSLNQQKEETKMVQADDASVHESVDINWERKLSTRLAPCLLDFHAGNYLLDSILEIWACNSFPHVADSPHTIPATGSCHAISPCRRP